MAKTICKLLGVVFILVGILGFLAPGMLGMHLSLAHNLVHIISGALALYFGLKGTLAGARLFCIVFGVVYLLLGVAGFLAGGGGAHSAGLGVDTGHHGAGDSRRLAVLPGALELASMDHTVHILLGIVGFLAGGAGSHTVAGVPTGHHGAGDSSLLAVLPGSLELATMDHIVHVLLGIVFLAGGFLTRADLDRAVD